MKSPTSNHKRGPDLGNVSVQNPSCCGLRRMMRSRRWWIERGGGARSSFPCRGCRVAAGHRLRSVVSRHPRPHSVGSSWTVRASIPCLARWLAAVPAAVPCLPYLAVRWACWVWPMLRRPERAANASRNAPNARNARARKRSTARNASARRSQMERPAVSGHARAGTASPPRRLRRPSVRRSAPSAWGVTGRRGSVRRCPVCRASLRSGVRRQRFAVREAAATPSMPAIAPGRARVVPRPAPPPVRCA
jgi:hypothetical protein